MPKIISAGFAVCALASASMPAFSGDVWGDSELAMAPADDMGFEVLSLLESIAGDRR